MRINGRSRKRLVMAKWHNIKGKLYEKAQKVQKTTLLTNTTNTDSHILAYLLFLQAKMTLQEQIERKCKPLQIRIIKHDLLVFDKIGGITFKAVPVSESDGVLWLCRTQNTSAEPLEKYGEITASKICETLNILFPTKQ